MNMLQNSQMEPGQYAIQIGGEKIRAALSQPRNDLNQEMTGRLPHRYVRLTLDRWALDEPNRFRMICQQEVHVEWLMEAALEQGDQEMELLTSLSARQMREQGMMDTDILKESAIPLRICEALPFPNMD